MVIIIVILNFFIMIMIISSLLLQILMLFCDTLYFLPVYIITVYLGIVIWYPSIADFNLYLLFSINTFNYVSPLVDWSKALSLVKSSAVDLIRAIIFILCTTYNLLLSSREVVSFHLRCKMKVADQHLFQQ